MKAIALFGKMLTFSRLRITSDDLDEIKTELMTLTTGRTPIPVVIDSTVSLDLSALVDMLWEMGIHPIGVVEGELTAQAGELRLATFPTDGKRIERLKPIDKPKKLASEPTPEPTPKPTATTTEIDLDMDDDVVVLEKPTANTAPTTETEISTDTPAMVEISATNDTDTADTVQAVASNTQTGSFGNASADDEEHGLTSSIHNQMLRSGQSLQHLGGDLIVIGGVNNGAEAITDNNLHIYGHGQGRLVAGATGDKDARIFCQKFNPSLVSVAGTYCLRDAIPSEMIDKAVQVSYDENKGLVFTLMTP